MEIRWLGEVCSALPSSGGRGATDRDPIGQSPFPRGKLGVSLRQFRRKRPEQAIDGPGTSSSRVGNTKIPYTLTLSLPFPVVRNQDLDHTIKPRQSL